MAFSAEALRKQLGKVREGARGAGRASSRRGVVEVRCAAVFGWEKRKGRAGPPRRNASVWVFVSRSQYKFRDLTVEEVTAVSRAHPNFSFSMNTYSKKGCGALKGVWVLACLVPWGNTSRCGAGWDSVLPVPRAMLLVCSSTLGACRCHSASGLPSSSCVFTFSLQGRIPEGPPEFQWYYPGEIW